MEYQITVEGLDKLIEQAAMAGANGQKVADAAAFKGALKIQEIARDNAPIRTGNLKRSILVDDIGGAVFRVNVNEKYGLYVERGTAAHDIYPSKKKALFWKGAQYPVKVVHHPGSKAHPFFEPAIIAARPFIQKYFEQAALSIARQLAEGRS